MAKIISVKKKRPQQALENLNRLTGLDFQSLPESLINEEEGEEEPAPAGQAAPLCSAKTGTQ